MLHLHGVNLYWCFCVFWRSLGLSVYRKHNRSNVLLNGKPSLDRGCIFFDLCLIWCCLSVLVLGLYEQHSTFKTLYLTKIATLFGVVWVGLVIASGFISVIGLDAVVELARINAERASETWNIVTLLTESLGGGNELVGGMWVLLISVSNLHRKIFSSWLNYIGLFVGVVGVATVYPAEIFAELFGVSQIVWFLWVGVSLIRNSNDKRHYQVEG